MKFSRNEFLQGLWEGTNSDWVKWIHRNLSDNHENQEAEVKFWEQYLKAEASIYNELLKLDNT